MCHAGHLVKEAPPFTLPNPLRLKGDSSSWRTPLLDAKHVWWAGGAGRDVRLEGEELVGYHLETWDKESNCYRKGLVVAFNPSQVGGCRRRTGYTSMINRVGRSLICVASSGLCFVQHLGVVQLSVLVSRVCCSMC